MTDNPIKTAINNLCDMNSQAQIKQNFPGQPGSFSTILIGGSELTLEEGRIVADLILGKEVERLKAQNAELLEALKESKGMDNGHHHWDDTMMRGLGCPLCVKQRTIREKIEAAIRRAEEKK